MLRRRRTVLLSTVLAGMAAAACSDRAYVTTASLAARVAQQQRMRTPDLTVGNVTCTRLRATPGATATCTVRVDRADLTVRATYNGPDAVTLTPTRAAIDLVRAVEDVKAGLPASAADATVTCGPPGAKVLLTDPGHTFTCSIVLGGTTRTTRFRVLDLDGHVQEVA